MADRPRGARLDRARTADAAGRRIGHGIRAVVRRMAHVLRAHRREGHRGAGLRGHALRRLGPARLHRPHARMEPRLADLHRHPGAPRAAREAAGLGRGQAQFHLDLPRAAARSRHARAARGAGPRPAGCRPLARSSGARTASRCTRSRRCACSSPTAGSRKRTAPTSGWRPVVAGGAGDADGAHRLAPRRARSGRPLADPRRRGARPVVQRRRSGRRVGHRPRSTSAYGSRASCGASC